jgi:hypothetical protein
MAQFRNRPIVREATQWFKHGDHEMVAAVLPDHAIEALTADGKDPSKHGWIETLEGGHVVSPTDWIITGAKGEHYPCKAEIFEMTYEPVRKEPSPSRSEVAMSVTKDLADMRKLSQADAIADVKRVRAQTAENLVRYFDETLIESLCAGLNMFIDESDPRKRATFIENATQIMKVIGTRQRTINDCQRDLVSQLTTALPLPLQLTPSGPGEIPLGD